MNNITEYYYSKILYTKGYLSGQDIYSRGSKYFNIQYFSYNKTHKFYFRCTNQKCRKHYIIITNSFFSQFSYNNLQIIPEIIKCFIGIECNAEKTLEYLKEEKQIQISKQLILRV